MTTSTSHSVFQLYDSPVVPLARPLAVAPLPLESSMQADAVAADQRATVQMSLALLWRELSLGLCQIVDTFFTEQRCYLTTRGRSGTATPLEGRRLEILEAVLAGTGQKRVAIDLALAPSTIALNARLGLCTLGVESRPSRVHPLLMLAAIAGRQQNPRIMAALSFFSRGEDEFRVLAVSRPDALLHRALPPAELAVIRSLVEGASYEEIAQVRGTSTRTIANQITAVFRRMKVSGRSELMLRLFADRGSA